ncbi:hypothetical protein ACJMK2_024108, partial [Sinanodonta woodiana]
VIQIRNQIFHSPFPKVSDTDKDTGFDKILLLLSDLNIRGIILPQITELKTKDIDEYYREKELKTHQKRVSELLNDVKILKGSFDHLPSDQPELRVMPIFYEVSDVEQGLTCSGDIFESFRREGKNEIFQSKKETGYLQSAVGWRHESQEQQMITELRERRSEVETYAQVISAMETFMKNNPDLSAGNILEDLRAASDAVKEMQSGLSTK